MLGEDERLRRMLENEDKVTENNTVDSMKVANLDIGLSFDSVFNFLNVFVLS